MRFVSFSFCKLRCYLCWLLDVGLHVSMLLLMSVWCFVVWCVVMHCVVVFGLCMRCVCASLCDVVWCALVCVYFGCVCLCLVVMLF